ncbi:MAG: Trm112 family protein, partial [Planctomycetota bacterium]
MNAELLTILRCPCDPNVTLEHRETGFVCTRCRVEFPIRDQVP